MTDASLTQLTFAHVGLTPPVNLPLCFKAAEGHPTPSVPPLQAVSLLSPVEILYLSSEDHACYALEGAALQRLNIAEVRPAFLRDLWVAGWAVLELLPEDQLRHVPAPTVQLMPLSDYVRSTIGVMEGTQYRDESVLMRWRTLVHLAGAGQWRYLKMLGDPRPVDACNGGVADVTQPASEALYATINSTGVTPYGVPPWLPLGAVRETVDAVSLLQASERQMWAKYLRHRRFRFWTICHEGDL